MSRGLETRVPPPLVVLAAAGLMWGAIWLAPGLRYGFPGRAALAIAAALLGAAIALAGLAEFRRARTTIDPRKPEEASALVEGGVYRVTRNPMYLGMLCVLLGWAIYLGSPLAVLVLPLFVAYLTRFQIAPEERALQAKFGAAFEAYRRRVRRWL